MQRLCACGCGQPTPPATWTDRSRGVIKGQPVEYISGHKLRETMSSLEWRIASSERRTGRKAVVSPYVPGLLLCWSKRYNRWQCKRHDTKSSMYHSQAVWEYFNGPVPEGMHVHHKNGRADRIEDDAPDNLMLLDRKWNSYIFPTIARTLDVPESWVTDALLEADPAWADDQLFVYIVNAAYQRKG